MEKRTLTPVEIYQETIASGIKKGTLPSMKLFINGIFAGVFVALAAVASSTASSFIDSKGASKLASSAVFPVGLILIIICGGELFTGNSLMLVALMEKKISYAQVIRNWIIVYFSNFIGSFIIAYLTYLSGLYLNNMGKVGGFLIKTAAYKGGLSFTQALAGGILCNILVCLAVWGSYASRDVGGKIAFMWFPVMAFVLSGFEHSVANMYYFLGAIFARLDPICVVSSQIESTIKNVSITGMLGNLVPVTIGNIIGGGIFVGLGYWTIYKNNYIYEQQRKGQNF